MPSRDEILHAKILVVDDSADNVDLMLEILREAGYTNVASTMLPEQVCPMHRQQCYDLILLDLQMPGLNGFQVMKGLKEIEQGGYLPVLALTAQPSFKIAALEAGARDFISKPFNIAVVRARVRSQLTIKRQADAMRELSLTDGLTGVANRRNFNDTMDAEWRRCARSGMPLSVIMIDIDHFKLYNDHYGHQAGDDCLQLISAAMKGCASRPQDLLARYGGEEFILLLPQEGAEGTRVVAQRILDEVRKLNLPHDVSPSAPHVSISMGLATAMPPLDTHDASAVIRAADAHLYRAKQTGRNRYCVNLD